MTYDQARQIALDVFEANFLRLVDIAAHVARDRVEQFTRDYLDKLQAEDPSALNGVQDPDTLKSIYVAQEAFARSGEEDLEKVLVDLLVDRTKQKDRELKTLVLNDAVAALPKLSMRQRKSIAIVFLLRYTRRGGLGPLPDYYAFLAQGIAPFVDDLSNRVADYTHIQSTGAGAVSVGHWDLTESFMDGSSGFFTKGFSIDEIPGDLRHSLGDGDIFVQCLRDPSKVQVNVVSAKDARKLALIKNLDPNQLEQLANRGAMREADVREDLTVHVAKIGQVFDLWDYPDSIVRRCDLTAVGLAIGHAYWRQATGDTSPLDNWLLSVVRAVS